MMYQIGAISLDTRPFTLDGVERSAGADFATKALISGLPGREFMGEGDDRITLSGQLLPARIGGLSELEALHGFGRAGARLPVMRGDGKMVGWFVLLSIDESHSSLSRDGIGYVLRHRIELMRVEPASGDEAGNILGTILSIFGAL